MSEELSLDEWLQKEYPNKRGEQTRPDSSTENRERWELAMLKKRESLENQGIKTNVLHNAVASELKTNPELYIVKSKKFYDSKGNELQIKSTTDTRTWDALKNLRGGKPYKGDWEKMTPKEKEDMKKVMNERKQPKEK